MKRNTLATLAIFAMLLCSFAASSQMRAVTEYGDTIFVYNNGTWSFEELEESPNQNEFAYLNAVLEIDTLENDFFAPENATKKVSNVQGQFSIMYNENQWKRIPPATINEEAEFAFQSKESDIWCVVISEVTTIEKDKLYRIAKKTMEDNTGASVEILSTDLRKVNGTNVLHGVLKADFSGITFIFDSYYYSDELGSVQFTVWSSDKVWKISHDKIEKLLNGFVVEQDGE